MENNSTSSNVYRFDGGEETKQNTTEQNRSSIIELDYEKIGRNYDDVILEKYNWTYSNNLPSI